LLYRHRPGKQAADRRHATCAFSRVNDRAGIRHARAGSGRGRNRHSDGVSVIVGRHEGWRTPPDRRNRPWRISGSRSLA
jgi:hypothetical protein